jgi:hypothetical protein
MTTRAIRLLAFLLPLLALGSVVSLASSGLAIVGDGNPPAAALCPTDSNLTLRRTIHTSTHSRIAQFGKCRCCGRDENGHCNHQCCE